MGSSQNPRDVRRQRLTKAKPHLHRGRAKINLLPKTRLFQAGEGRSELMAWNPEGKFSYRNHPMWADGTGTEYVLKKGRVSCGTSSSRTPQLDLRITIVTWIEPTYHRRRREARLGRLTPVEFEALMTTPADLAA